jgi:hypothetical protein
MRAVLRLFAGLILSVPVWALGLADLSNQDCGQRLKGRAYTKLCYGSLEARQPWRFSGKPAGKDPTARLIE